MFWLYGLHVLTILITITLQVQCSAFEARTHAACINGPPDHRILGEHKRLGSLETGNEATGSESRVILAPIEIDLWFHIVSSEAAAELVSEEMVDAQVSCSP